MKSKLSKHGSIILSLLMIVSMILPTALAVPIEASAEAVGLEESKAAADYNPSSASAIVPRIRYYVPNDEWQRDFVMTEKSSYYSIVIPGTSAKISVYDRTNGQYTSPGYAGLDAVDQTSASKNVNVEFEAAAGSTAYKYVRVNSEYASDSIEICVDKSTNLIYGISGTKPSPVYSNEMTIKVKTPADSSFNSFGMVTDADDSNIYTYTIDAVSAEIDFVYNNASVTNNLTFKIEDSLRSGIQLTENQTANTVAAAVTDTENCDKIKIRLDKTTGNVYAEAVKSDISTEDNKAFYLEGRFAYKDAQGSTVSVNGTAWSVNSVQVKFEAADTDGLYKLVTYSTISELSGDSGAPNYFFVRQGKLYPRVASGKFYSPPSNTSLKNTAPGSAVAVSSGSVCNGGLYFNDKNNTSGKVTIWFDITDQTNPSIYYTLRYDNFTAKAMYSSGSSEYVDNSAITVTVNPANSIELPQGAAVTAQASVQESGKEYTFVEWVTQNGTGSFENASAPETVFYPSSDNETLIARYKLAFMITCSSTGNGSVTVDNAKTAVGEEYTLTFVPTAGYSLSSLLINGVEKLSDTNNRATYTGVMPASSVTVQAVFTEIEEVYFYVAVQASWTTDVTRVTADGISIDTVKNCYPYSASSQLYDPGSTTPVLKDVVAKNYFAVNLFKADKYARILTGNPLEPDGSQTNNNYGHIIPSGQLVEGSCYYYYSQGIGYNYTGIINPIRFNSVTCLTADPFENQPVEISASVTDCKGKTAGQQAYSRSWSVKDANGSTFAVTNHKFTPTHSGVYTVTAQVIDTAANAVVGSKELSVNVKGSALVYSDAEVVIKYYDRDSADRTDMSDTAKDVTVTLAKSSNGLDQTVTDALRSVSGKLKKDMNLMCEYYFFTSQTNALDEMANMVNYHEPKRDNSNQIMRDEYGIAQYKTYGESYVPADLQYHTDAYGGITGNEQWVTYYSGDTVITEAEANENPGSVSKIVTYAFNTPRVYHIDMSYTSETDVNAVTAVDEANGLFKVSGSSGDVYDAFYNMSLSPETDYSNTGYLSNFVISDYYGSETMPTAADKVKDSNNNEYKFDGWYDTTNGGCVKVSSDLNYTSRITSNMELVALYKSSASAADPTVTVTSLDTERYTENSVDKIRLNNVINVFDFDSVSNTAIVYVRLKSTSTTDWEHNYSNIDIAALKENIKTAIESGDNVTGRKVLVVDVYNSNKAQIVADCYAVAANESAANAENYVIVLNNKNRIQFSNSFTAESARGTGGNAAILTFAAASYTDADSSDEVWVISENYIPYINVGE